jgi:hypothetical protein
MSAVPQRYRLVTRSDFDGLVCAVLLKHLDLIDDILFVHPKDMQDGKIAISQRDITTNLPYVAAPTWRSTTICRRPSATAAARENHVIDPRAPSAARVVYDYYGGGRAFPMAWRDMMDAVDKGDAARFSRGEVLDPSGWNLLNFLMDARTGLGRFHDFRISNYQLMMDLIDYCRNHGIEQIMAAARRARAHRAVPRAQRAVQGADPPLREAAQEPGRARPARGRGDLRRQPLHHLRAVPGNEYLDPRAVGPEKAEHGLRHRQIDPEPQLEHQHRRADAGIRRGRARECGDVPGVERDGGGCAGGVDTADYQRGLSLASAL